MFKYNPPKPRFARLERRPTDAAVSPHLAYDLSDLDDMVSRGMPVSTSNLDNQYYDGSPNTSFDLPIDMQRGVDINDVWCASQESKRKLSKSKVTRFELNPVQS